MDDVRYIKLYESHPGKTLIKHTIGVCDKATQIWDSPVVRIASKGHDFGKLNINFGKKLGGEDCTGLYTSHAYLSYLTLISYYLERKTTGIIPSLRDLIVAAVCVIKHHGALRNFDEIINPEERDRLFEFLKDDPYFPVHEFMKQIGFDTTGRPINHRLCIGNQKIFGAIFTDLKLLNREIPTRYDRLNLFLDTRMCFSALVYGDKGDAGGHDLSDSKKKQSKFMKEYYKKVNRYLDELSKKPATPLNTVRTEMREVALSNLREALRVNPDQRVFLVTYPTGSGKTVIMLSLAGVLHEMIGYDRIIYSIPFLSITEQIFSIIEENIFPEDSEVLKRIDSKASPNEDYDFEAVDKTFLRKALSFFKKILKGKNLKEEAIERLLREDYMESAFDYSLIVTTFVKLFQGFTTSSNRGLTKFSHFKGAILLIDEFQALPTSMYTFFTALIDAFCRKFGSCAVVSTATMPHLEIPITDSESLDMFRDYRPPVEIGDHSYFQHQIFNRYEIRVLKSIYTRFTISQEIAKSKVPTLAVFNTIRDSKEVYLILKAALDCPVYLLNSNFHPESRREILRKVKLHLANRERVFLISTQLIEAGVDIDFDVVYRDIAPIPNIIQTAGRCNREGKLGRGIVYLFQLYDDDLDKLRAKTIYNGKYDGVFLNYTFKVFFNNPNNQTVFEEKDLFTIQTNFFKTISSNFRLGVWESKEKNETSMVDQITKFQYGDIGQFRLIPESKFGLQVQFYVAYGPDDDSYEKLHEYLADQAIYEASPTQDKDKIKILLAHKKRIDDQIKVMRDRIVQANLPLDANLLDYTEDDYESQICQIYKLRDNLYDNEFGLTIL